MVTAELARLQGCERATLAASTLHAFWDLFGILAKEPRTVLVDSGVYPVARWGVERAAGRGVSVHTFEHHGSTDLAKKIREHLAPGTTPVVVADGFCPGCGRTTPIEEYLQGLRPHGGLLVLDDTQALGIHGQRRADAVPYGLGGGGSLHWAGVGGADVILISSLAKAFGAPLAAVSGSARWIERFEEESETRVHCSPPSAASLASAARALEVNDAAGDKLREALWERVQSFREPLLGAGVSLLDTDFPVQSVLLKPTAEADRLQDTLRRGGVHAILQPGHDSSSLAFRLTFIVTVLHHPRNVVEAVEALLFALPRGLSQGLTPEKGDNNVRLPDVSVSQATATHSPARRPLRP